MGRPKEFDPDTVLEKAMEVFWKRGYVGTSVQDLVAHTGINRASLYAEFGDKHSLFLAALERYRQKVVPTRAGILEAPHASLPQIREYFEAVAGDLATSRDRRGCLLVNSAIELAAEDSGVRDKVDAHLDRLEQGFSAALRSAVKKGEITAPSSIPSLARFLVTASQGLMVVGKARPDAAALKQIVKQTLNSLKDR